MIRAGTLAAALVALACSPVVDALGSAADEMPPHCGLSSVDVEVPAGATIYGNGSWLTRGDVSMGCSARATEVSCIASGGLVRVWYADSEPTYTIGDNDPALDWDCAE